MASSPSGPEDLIVELAKEQRRINVDDSRSLFQRAIFGGALSHRSLWDRYHILPLGVRISPDIPKLLSTAETVGELASVLCRVLGTLFFLQHETPAALPLPDVLCKPGLVCEHPSTSPLLSSPRLGGLYSPSPASSSTQDTSPARTSRLPFKASRRLNLLEKASRPLQFDSIIPLGTDCVYPRPSLFSIYIILLCLGRSYGGRPRKTPGFTFDCGDEFRGFFFRRPAPNDNSNFS